MQSFTACISLLTATSTFRLGRRHWSHGRPQEGARGGSPDPLDFDINFSHIITVAPTVEIQMHFWKGAKFAGSVGHPMTKMLSASGGLRPPDQGLCPWTLLGALPPDPRYRLVLRTRYGAPQPLTPSATYDPLKKILWVPLTGVLPTVLSDGSKDLGTRPRT